MKLLPVHNESFVLHEKGDEFLGRLRDVTRIVKKQTNAYEPQGHKLFNGLVLEESFSISLMIRQPNNFLPLIQGDLVTSDNSCLLSVKYRLFPSTRRFIVFWSILTVLLTLFFALPYQAYLYAAISFSLGLVNYILTLENFKIQVRKSSRVFHKIVQTT